MVGVNCKRGFMIVFLNIKHVLNKLWHQRHLNKLQMAKIPISFIREVNSFLLSFQHRDCIELYPESECMSWRFSEFHPLLSYLLLSRHLLSQDLHSMLPTQPYGYPQGVTPTVSRSWLLRLAQQKKWLRTRILTLILKRPRSHQKRNKRFYSESLRHGITFAAPWGATTSCSIIYSNYVQQPNGLLSSLRFPLERYYQQTKPLVDRINYWFGMAW